MDSFLLKIFIDNLAELQKVMLSSACKKDPAEELFKNKTRSILFRVEALCRICRIIYSKKLFNELNSPFKLMEDGLGAIEYYNDFYTEFSSIKSIPAPFLNYFKNNLEQEKINLTKKIVDGNYCNPVFFRQIESSLKKIQWLNADEERVALINFLVRQCEIITEDLDSGELNFNDIEKGLHETRRKIRWISIYAAVVNGVIQIKKTLSPNTLLKPYLTPEIINLPFNKLPKPVKGIKPVYIQSQNFYALSWIINELGKLKDEGLKGYEVEKAIKESKLKLSETERVKKLLTTKVRAARIICDEAENIVDDFIFNNGVLERIKRDLKRNFVSR